MLILLIMTRGKHTMINLVQRWDHCGPIILIDRISFNLCVLVPLLILATFYQEKPECELLANPEPAMQVGRGILATRHPKPRRGHWRPRKVKVWVDDDRLVRALLSRQYPTGRQGGRLCFSFIKRLGQEPICEVCSGFEQVKHMSWVCNTAVILLGCSSFGECRAHIKRGENCWRGR